MITNICLLLEALTVVFCLHYLYGEKVKLDIETTSFLAINMIIMATINYYKLPKVYTLIIYPVIIIYCGMRFGFKLKSLIINLMMCVIMIGGIQLIVSAIYGCFFGTLNFGKTELLVVNGIVILIVVFLIPKCKVDKLAVYLQDKERIFAISLAICIAITILCIINYKKFEFVETYQYVPLFVSIALICILTAQLGKFKVKSKEIETELKMHKLYAESFHNLIENIRLRQHEFDNHINAIYSQHYMYGTYEELVEAQENYCSDIVKENKYNKLLSKGNSVIIGFLYGKFMEMDKIGINVSYKIGINDLNVGIPIYKLVELIGNLINNAVDALETQENKGGLHVEIFEKDGNFEIEIRNESKYMDLSEIDMFFCKGYSKKGDNRGLGLYNVKNICNEYTLKIYCENKLIDNKNWLSFVVTIG